MNIIGLFGKEILYTLRYLIIIWISGFEDKVYRIA
jgi:hypothetical protein